MKQNIKFYCTKSWQGGLAYVFFEKIVVKLSCRPSMFKVFYMKTLKVFYSCMPNFRQLIMTRNQRMLKTRDKKWEMCDYKKQTFPINGICLIESLIHKATVMITRPRFYVSYTGLSFKNRYIKNRDSLKHGKHSNATALSQYV